MKRLLNFLGRTVVAGVLFLVPFVLLLVLLREGLRVIGKLLNPIAHRLPFDSAMGIATADLVAAVALLVVGFLAGLIAQTGIASRLNQRVEQMILRKMPGYTLLKSIVQPKAAASAGYIQPALAKLDDAWVLALIVEPAIDGLLTVFVPSAPTPTAGVIYYLTEEQVKRLNVPVSSVMKCIMQLGVGSQELLLNRMKTIV